MENEVNLKCIKTNKPRLMLIIRSTISANNSYF